VADPLDLDAVAASVFEQARRGVHYPPEWRGRLTTAQAYRVQLGCLARHLAGGERQAGWKVGLTNRRIQDQFGLHEPVLGFLLASGHRESGAAFRTAELIAPGFETELCVTLGATLAGPGVTREQARAAIAGAAPAFEIIENRGDFAADVSLSLADNCQQRAFVTGPTVPLPAGWRLPETRVTVRIDGTEVEQAAGDEGVCDPLAAVAWLANKLAELDRRLLAGMRVMSGSFTRQHPLRPGTRIEARFEPFGEVAASFS
jgi:2-keto-4-pentenoate hydratase